ncbi:prolyl oligopeptidase family serine peptidase [Erythrobacter sp. NE805]|uniref:S9 family peptidase n=1 Tax=Erythrobacter sp. NE805 TaxID=3389875 RepID=UPI00396B009F
MTRDDGKAAVPALSERYRSAAQALPTSVAAGLAGSAVEGHWIDADRFFFVTEVEQPDGAILPLPFLASRAAGSARPALPPERIFAALAARFPDFEAAARTALGYGCKVPGELVIRFRDKALTIDLETGEAVSEAHVPTQPEVRSPDGRHAVRIDGHDLVLHDGTTGEARPLTTDGEADWPYGQPPQASLASIALRRSPQPVALWSPGGEWLLTHRIDERHLPFRTIVESAPAGGGQPLAHRFRYATARDPLPRCRLVAIHPSSGRRVDMPDEDVTLFPPLLNRHAWFMDETRICRVRGDRHQRRLELVMTELATGSERVVLTEQAEDGYVESHPLIGHPPVCRYLASRDEVIWWSERDGWGHLYLFDARSGEVIRQLTQGQWQVRDIVDVDEAGRTVLITATGLGGEADPMLRSLARVCLDTGRTDLLLAGSMAEGDVAVCPEMPPPDGDGLRGATMPRSVSPDGGAVVVRRSGPFAPTHTLVLDTRTGRQSVIAAQTRRTEPERALWLDVTAADGTTALKAALYLPRWHDGRAPLPLLDLAYPGPQSVLLSRTDGGRVAAQAQALAELGLAAMICDSRGLPFRGRAFHQAGYGDLLEPQMADHVAVIGQLCERFAFLDRERVGILGASAGGAAAAYAMLAYPQVYRAGIAICGPYDPADYLCGWVLKYVGADRDGAWERQRIARLADRLEGRLLLIHGELDDNVHPTQTLRFADRLIAAGKRFEMLIVPGAGHMVQLTSAHAQQRIWDFLVEHLRGESPPAVPPLAYGPQELGVLGRVHGREAGWL